MTLLSSLSRFPDTKAIVPSPRKGPAEWESVNRHKWSFSMPTMRVFYLLCRLIAFGICITVHLSLATDFNTFSVSCCSQSSNRNKQVNHHLKHTHTSSLWEKKKKMVACLTCNISCSASLLLPSRSPLTAHAPQARVREIAPLSADVTPRRQG